MLTGCFQNYGLSHSNKINGHCVLMTRGRRNKLSNFNDHNEIKSGFYCNHRHIRYGQRTCRKGAQAFSRFEGSHLTRKARCFLGFDCSHYGRFF